MDNADLIETQRQKNFPPDISQETVVLSGKQRKRDTPKMKQIYDPKLEERYFTIEIRSTTSAATTLLF